MRAPATVTTERPAKARWLVFVAIVLIAAALRFTGLAWGLRHAPVRDEQSFVENAGLMLELRDLNHRFYEYPGLFIDLLCPVLAMIPPSTPYTSPWDGLPRMTRFGPSGYLAARGLVAAFGVLSVVLVYRLGSHLVSPSAGLVAALLQAVSPVETFVAHEVRPDVVLEFFVLLALLSYQKVGPRARQDLVAGLATGAAMAVKFTGLLIAPCYLLARWLSPGHRMRGALVAGFTAAAVWFLSTPYALLSFPEFVKGAAFQVNWHYRGGGFAPHFWSSVAYYLRTILWSLGPLGGVLAVVGLFRARRALRQWGPVLVYPLLLIVVLSTAAAHWHRLVVSGLASVVLAAALGFETIALRRRRLAWTVALAAAAFPCATSIDFLRMVSAPFPRDEALDWIHAHATPGARILTSIRELGLDRRRFEVVEESKHRGLSRRLARDADFVVWHLDDDTSVGGFDLIWRRDPRLGGGAFGERPEMNLSGLHWPVRVYRPTPALRTCYRTAPLTGATITVSSNGESGSSLIDGRMETLWATAKNQRPGDWLQVVVPSPIRLGRVELSLGAKPVRYGRNLTLDVTQDGKSWQRVGFVPGRPPVPEQIDPDQGRASQVLIVEPVLTRGVRVMQLEWSDRRWGYAEMRLDVIADDE